MDSWQRDILRERLLANRTVTEGGCWLWTKSCQPKGYGQTSIPGTGKNRRVHRVAASLWLGFDLDSDFLVIHSCDIPRCFNPAHLRAATAAENTADMMKRNRGDFRVRHGEANGWSKVSEEQVKEMRRRRQDGETFAVLGASYGITAQAVFAICKGKNWGHIL